MVHCQFYLLAAVAMNTDAILVDPSRMFSSVCYRIKRAELADVRRPTGDGICCRRVSSGEQRPSRNCRGHGGREGHHLVHHRESEVDFHVTSTLLRSLGTCQALFLSTPSTPMHALPPKHSRLLFAAPILNQGR